MGYIADPDDEMVEMANAMASHAIQAFALPQVETGLELATQFMIL